MLASLLNAAAARGTPDTLVLLLSHAGYDFLPASLSSADSTSDPSSPSPNHNSSSSPPSPSRPKLPIIAGLYPLHAAAGARRPSLDTLPMMNYLIHDLDLDVNALDDMKLDRYITGTPLHHAVQWDHLERVELLLEEGADPRIENQFYETPLKISVIRGQSAVIRGLLQDAIVVWEGRESQGEK
ncbi:hypothetical protein BJ170DRAFT_95655 [Xylariales sp. AK1849]|nr:hypothetical protein BJ170DRAFT_95655 [Xylariales sp. AK1849]